MLSKTTLYLGYVYLLTCTSGLLNTVLSAVCDVTDVCQLNALKIGLLTCNYCSCCYCLDTKEMKHSINLRAKAVYNKIGLAAGRHSDSWEAYSTPQTTELSFKGDVEDRGTEGWDKGEEKWVKEKSRERKREGFVPLLPSSPQKKLGLKKNSISSDILVKCSKTFPTRELLKDAISIFLFHHHIIISYRRP